MTAPNKNMLWAQVLVDELVRQGVDAACLLPGSRSTPLVTAFSERENLTLYSHLDERSSAYFALGRAKKTRTPVPLVSTSGTAAVNFHPAVVEGFHARVPMLLLTADRPPELMESGANQTINQTELYGNAVQWFYQLPEPEADRRKLRSLRTVTARGFAVSTGCPPGPVHLNVPFRKPLEPVEVPFDVPDDFSSEPPGVRSEQTEEPVRIREGTPVLDKEDIDRLAREAASVERPMIVAGPASWTEEEREWIVQFAASSGCPIAADPLSGFRYGPVVEEATVLGAYDAYVSESFFQKHGEPELVVRIGARPTSKQLYHTLAETSARQILVQPSGEWEDDTFTCSELLVADPARLCRKLTEHRQQITVDSEWREALVNAERVSVEQLETAAGDAELEGGYIRKTLQALPDGGTIFVSNSMPVRDLDRFGTPALERIHAYGNRGASGIDGITSTVLGTASASSGPVVLVTGDLAFYHDMNGLLAFDRFDLNCTIVLINNDGGGIFHMLPIEDHDPPFSEYVKTPHGLDFSPVSELYNVSFQRAEDLDDFEQLLNNSLEQNAAEIIEVTVDAEASHRKREQLRNRIQSELNV